MDDRWANKIDRWSAEDPNIPRGPLAPGVEVVPAELYDDLLDRIEQANHIIGKWEDDYFSAGAALKQIRAILKDPYHAAQ